VAVGVLVAPLPSQRSSGVPPPSVPSGPFLGSAVFLPLASSGPHCCYGCPSFLFFSSCVVLVLQVRFPPCGKFDVAFVLLAVGASRALLHTTGSVSCLLLYVLCVVGVSWLVWEVGGGTVALPFLLASLGGVSWVSRCWGIAG